MVWINAREACAFTHKSLHSLSDDFKMAMQSQRKANVSKKSTISALIDWYLYFKSFNFISQALILYMFFKIRYKVSINLVIIAVQQSDSISPCDMCLVVDFVFLFSIGSPTA